MILNLKILVERYLTDLDSHLPRTQETIHRYNLQFSTVFYSLDVRTVVYIFISFTELTNAISLFVLSNNST